MFLIKILVTASVMSIQDAITLTDLLVKIPTAFLWKCSLYGPIDNLLCFEDRASLEGIVSFTYQ